MSDGSVDAPVPRTRSVQADDGVTIVYDDWGPQEGDAVLLCHGLAAAGAQMNDDAAFFAAHGFRVLVPDLRGHGRSGKARSDDADGYSFARMGRDMLGVLDDAGVANVHWVGNSLGGILALSLLEQDEARFRTLATFGTAYGQQLPGWTPLLFPLTHALLGRRLKAWLTAALTTRNQAARPLVARLVAASDPQVGRQIAIHACRYDFTAAACAATVPILLLRGGRDTAVNAALAPTLEAMRTRTNFTLVDLPEGGHCANLDATDLWRETLTHFWRRSGTGV
jgi:pimeloyl-ACP methyl ester carboxylesterase